MIPFHDGHSSEHCKKKKPWSSGGRCKKGEETNKSKDVGRRQWHSKGMAE